MILDTQGREYWDAFLDLSGEIQDLFYLQRTKAADVDIQKQLHAVRRAMEGVQTYEEYWLRRATDFNKRQGSKVENPDEIVEHYRKVAPLQIIEQLNLSARSLREGANANELDIDDVRKKVAEAAQLIHGESRSRVVRAAMGLC